MPLRVLSGKYSGAKESPIESLAKTYKTHITKGLTAKRAAEACLQDASQAHAISRMSCACRRVSEDISAFLAY